MIPMRTIGCLAAATAFLVGVLIVVPGSPAGAVEPTMTTTIAPQLTGSLVDNGDGTATLTYANADIVSGRLLTVVFLPSGATCGADPIASISRNSLLLSSQAPGFPASPMLISTATSVISFPDFPTPLSELVTLSAAEYQTCLYLTVAGSGFALASSALITFGGSAPAPEPVVPAHTG